MRPPDPAFADPRLAGLYDVLDDDRSDLDAYLAIADEVNARSVVDIGCGTDSLAVRLAQSGRTVVGVDPAAASSDLWVAPTLAFSGPLSVATAPDRPGKELVFIAAVSSVADPDRRPGQPSTR